MDESDVRTKDVEEGLENLRQVGYTIHEGALSPEVTSELRERILEQAEQELAAGIASFGETGYGDVGYSRSLSDPERLPRYQQVGFGPNKGRCIIDLVSHPLAHEYLGRFLDVMPYHLSTASGVIVRPGADHMVIHTDQAVIPFETPIPVGLNILYALSDFTEEVGATRMVPGSHRMPPPDFTMDKDVLYQSTPTVPIECPAGSAILFESRTWHCQGPACPSAPFERVMIATNFQYCFFTPQENYPASLHDDVFDTLSDDEKRYLGFELVNTMGQIAPRFPGDVRTNSNVRFAYTPALHRGD